MICSQLYYTVLAPKEDTPFAHTVATLSPLSLLNFFLSPRHASKLCPGILFDRSKRSGETRIMMQCALYGFGLPNVALSAAWVLSDGNKGVEGIGAIAWIIYAVYSVLLIVVLRCV